MATPWGAGLWVNYTCPIDVTVDRHFPWWSQCQVKFQRWKQLSGHKHQQGEAPWLNHCWRLMHWNLPCSTSNSLQGSLPAASLSLQLFIKDDPPHITGPKWRLSPCRSMLRSLSDSLVGGIHTPPHSALISQLLKISLLFQRSVSLHCSPDTTSSFPSSFWCRVLWVARDGSPTQIYLGRKGKFLDSPNKEGRAGWIWHRWNLEPKYFSDGLSQSCQYSRWEDSHLLLLSKYFLFWAGNNRGEEVKLSQSPGFRFKNSREESDWPGLCQVPISGIMVVAKRLSPVIGLT